MWNHYTCPKTSMTEGAIKKMKLIKNAGSNLNKSRTMIKKDQ